MSKIKILLSLLTLVFTLQSVSQCTHVNYDDLIAFYNSTNGANWTNNTGWVDGAAGTNCNPCDGTWFGIACNQAGEVANIQLPSNNLVGTIAPEITNILTLTNVRLQSNQLSGNIPAQIGNLTSLTFLYLTDNQLTGSIPTSIGNLTNMFILKLENNQLNGEVPHEITQLVDVGSVWLEGNNLSGCIDTVLHTFFCDMGYFSVLNNPQMPYEGQLFFMCNSTIASQIGAPCNDGNPNSFNDVINADCSCGTNSSIMGCTDSTFCEYNPSATIDDGSCATPFVCGACTNSDFNKLIEFYNKTNGANWTNNTGWIDGAAGTNCNPCDGTWYGIVCNASDVITDIYLSSNNLTDSIPAVIGNFTGLNALDFRNNNLIGSIPTEIGNLINLTSLNLGQNDLTGSIPSEIGNLTNLSTLDLNRNDLTGSIPTELGNLSNISSIRISENMLSGSIPTEFGNLLTLASLRIHQNQLTGSIPVSLGNLSNLSQLSMYQNQLTGSIPSSFGNLSNLNSLNISSNMLTDSLPIELGMLSNLSSLSISSNNFIGEIPAEFGNLSNLSQFYGNHNNLTGFLPTELSMLSNLSQLDLSNNDLFGPIPASYGMLNVNNLILNNNNLSGEIPVELGDLSTVTFLDLSFNQLSGNIPTELGNLTTLGIFRLNNNQFTGSIPPSFGNLTNLNSMYLDHNLLTGNIPSEIGNLTGIGQLRLNNNLLSGLIPIEVGNLSSAFSINLSQNNLVGEIPIELAQLNVSNMQINNNNLSGCIDSVLVAFICDLSSNTISDNPLLPFEGAWFDLCGTNGSTAQQIGTPCDDGDSTSVNDVINADCTCGNNVPETGCINSNYCEYNPNAITDDGSCTTLNDDPGTCNIDPELGNLESWNSTTCFCDLIECPTNVIFNMDTIPSGADFQADSTLVTTGIVITETGGVLISLSALTYIELNIGFNVPLGSEIELTIEEESCD